MKALKKIGIILLLLIVGFLTIGMFSGEQKYHLEIEIDRPVEFVFKQFNSHETLQKWLPEVKSFETIKETPNKIGSEYKMLIEKDGKSMEIHETLTDFKENEIVEMIFHADSMIKNNLFIFEQKENSTLVIAKYKVVGNNPIAKSMFALFANMFETIDQENLQRFKKFCEQDRYN